MLRLNEVFGSQCWVHVPQIPKFRIVFHVEFGSLCDDRSVSLKLNISSLEYPIIVHVCSWQKAHEPNPNPTPYHPHRDLHLVT